MGWICHKCSSYNDDDDTSCLVCGLGKEESKTKDKEAKEKVIPVVDKPKHKVPAKEYVPVRSVSSEKSDGDLFSKIFCCITCALIILFILSCIFLSDNWKVLQYIVAIFSTIISTVVIVSISFYLEEEFYDFHHFYGQIGYGILTLINSLLFIFIGLNYSVIAIFIGISSLMASIIYFIISHDNFDPLWPSILIGLANLAIVICGFVL